MIFFRDRPRHDRVALPGREIHGDNFLSPDDESLVIVGTEDVPRPGRRPRK